MNKVELCCCYWWKTWEVSVGELSSTEWKNMNRNSVENGQVSWLLFALVAFNYLLCRISRKGKQVEGFDIRLNSWIQIKNQIVSNLNPYSIF